VNIPKTSKPRIIVLGSGWGAVSFMKAIKKDVAAKYDVILLSPRNYFLYTPLLPAVATGTVEERSIVEPIRNIVIGKGEYYEAECQSIDPDTKTLTACFPQHTGLPNACFNMTYDHLIVAVGSVNNTFGIEGVQNHCFFFKSIGDANKLRRQLSECFERAALPYTPPEVRLATFLHQT
jgi:NADH:ubiquinone reductase (non-electrogenic)